MSRTALRICPLREATCGLTLTVDNGRITHARGDRDDVFSAGFTCAKGATIGALDAARLGLADGELARIKGDGGEVVAPVEITDALHRGVVCLPHGWRHDREGTRLTAATRDPRAGRQR